MRAAACATLALLLCGADAYAQTREEANARKEMEAHLAEALTLTEKIDKHTDTVCGPAKHWVACRIEHGMTYALVTDIRVAKDFQVMLRLNRRLDIAAQLQQEIERRSKKLDDRLRALSNRYSK